jgi:hypothetical protein
VPKIANKLASEIANKMKDMKLSLLQKEKESVDIKSSISKMKSSEGKMSATNNRSSYDGNKI